MSPKLIRDAKRSADHKHKWKLGDKSATVGGKPRPLNSPVMCNDKLRWPPSRPSPYQDKTVGTTVRKLPAVVVDNEVIASSHDPALAPYSTSSSSAESVPHASLAPEPDAGVAYSFDAVRDPSDGTGILGQAMSKAVARFEDQRTTRLVKDEYDVVKCDEDDDVEGEMAEDFELVGKFEM